MHQEEQPLSQLILCKSCHCTPKPLCLATQANQERGSQGPPQECLRGLNTLPAVLGYTQQ